MSKEDYKLFLDGFWNSSYCRVAKGISDYLWHKKGSRAAAQEVLHMVIDYTYHNQPVCERKIHWFEKFCISYALRGAARSLSDRENRFRSLGDSDNIPADAENEMLIRAEDGPEFVKERLVDLGRAMEFDETEMERHVQLWVASNQLDPFERQLYHLVYIDGERISGLSRRLKVNPKALTRIKKRITGKIKKHMRDYYGTVD